MTVNWPGQVLSSVNGNRTMRKILYGLTIVGLIVFAPLAGFPEERRSVSARRVDEAPRIDGRMDEQIWRNLPLLTGFIQYMPHNGQSASQETEARIGYDDRALYIGVFCLDTVPDQIRRELRPRDDYGEMNSDLLSVLINPYNDSLNSFYFMVSAAGVQADSKFSGDMNDQSWDAVWESAVTITREGWTVEIRIPFSTLRFSSRMVQDWGVNLWRWISRNREWSSWNPVRREIQGWQKQNGILRGVQNLDPPLRLSLTPYLSGYIEKGPAAGWGRSFNGGTDLKYGINDSFTLDLTLIPDFGQIQSDDELLNLTPYEIQFNEKRQFFTEGSELFNKGNIYYSRRIGDQPVGYDIVSEQLGESEELVSNPEEARLINATKISGRTNNGLGIGILNAMTAPAFARIRDLSSGEERRIMTQSFTNYNLAVLDQTLFRNSYISLSNSNVARSGCVANVTATEFIFADRSNTYRAKGTGAFSWIRDEGQTTDGYKAFLEIGKYGGRWQYHGSLSVISDQYNQNDFGYLRRNNEVMAGMVLSHQIYEPFGCFLSLVNSLELTTHRMYRPNAFSDVILRYWGEALFRNQYGLQWEFQAAPLEQHDYWETRTSDRYVILPRYLKGWVIAGSDPRQALAVNIRAGFQRSMKHDFPVTSQELGISPVVRFNDHLNLKFQGLYTRDRNQPGYICGKEDGDTIIFGRRDRRTVENILEASYTFNSKASLIFRVRHYWSAAEYDRFYQLENSGRLVPSDYSDEHDINYNAFNIYMTFRWNFAPGSEILINWKNAVYASDAWTVDTYWDNLGNILDSNKTNSLSIKVLYYFDGLFGLFRRKS